jgi:hypothetical protein
MNHLTHILKSTFLLIALVGFVGTSIADDDKDKKNNGDKPSKSSTQKDSVLLDIDVDAPDTDDTLVFEDWDTPGSGDDIGANENQVAIGLNLNVNDSKDPLKDAFGDMLADKISSMVKPDYTVEFTVYPNPTVSQLQIRTYNIPNSIRVSDIMGRTYISSSFSSEIGVAELPTGTYVIQLVYDDHIESRKFVKN